MHPLKNLLFLCIFFSALLIAEEQPELALYTEASPPANFIEHGVLTGSSVEIVREIMKRLGVNYEIEVVPWARGYAIVQSKANTVLFSTTLTEERKDMFKWVGPLVRINWSLYALKDSAIKINSLEDAKKVSSIGTYRDDAREQYLIRQGFTNLQSVNDNQMNVNKLFAKRVDLIASSNTGIDKVLELVGKNRNDVKEVYVIKSVDLYIAFSKETDDAIVESWQKKLDEMVEDGTYGRIYKKWYPYDEPPL